MLRGDWCLRTPLSAGLGNVAICYLMFVMLATFGPSLGQFLIKIALNNGAVGGTDTFR